MSEYQYYEFLAIDKPLTAQQVEEVRTYSSRADISSTSFVNEYHFGDFRGSPENFLKNWFDAMLYSANWGTHRRQSLCGTCVRWRFNLNRWRTFSAASEHFATVIHEKKISSRCSIACCRRENE